MKSMEKKINITAKDIICMAIIIMLLAYVLIKIPQDIEINIDTGAIQEILNPDCFKNSELSFECEYTNAGDLIPILNESGKYWQCFSNNDSRYIVRAC